MKNLEITFYKTVYPIEVSKSSNYHLSRSLGEYKSFKKSYNTNNYKRALSFAKREVERLRNKSKELQHLNTGIEFLD